jgi:dihydroorotate dehydrogenase electron transfer subunit
MQRREDMKIEKAKIIDNRMIAEGLFLMIVESPKIADLAKVGQFAMLQINEGIDPYLRRPLCFYNISKHNGQVEFVYKIVGKGTRILAEKIAGESISLIGPLGVGWTLLEGSKQIAVVGRGIGAAPVICVAQEAHDKGIKVKAFLSAKTPELIIGRDLLTNLGCEMYLQSDEGEFSKGYSNVTNYLKDVLKEEKIDQIFVCGSRRLGKEVLELSKQYDIQSQISLEERMACGIGACVGCVTDIITERGKGKKEQKRVCKEGPVFWIEEVAELYDYKLKG